MKTIVWNENLRAHEACVATIGMFDGVHRGHGYLLQQLQEEAHRLALPTMVITFDKHPRQVLHADFQPELLSTYDEKLLRLSTMGVDECVVLPFSPSLAAYTAHDFMQRILGPQLGVKLLLMGYDNHFGCRKEDVFDDYVRYGKEMGIDVRQGRALCVDGTNVSSSVVRRCLQQGDILRANDYLGYAYSLTGTVVTGEHVGTGIGFPTANLHPDACQLIPAPGVYAVKVMTEDAEEQKIGMMNIGCRPTFDGHQMTLETHILHFADNLYGQRLRIFFVRRLREEQKFDSKEALMEQLRKDAEAVSREMNAVL